MLTIDQLRSDFGSAITVSSGFRCAKHNKAIGGAKQSRHTVGDACDMVASPDLLAFIQSRLEHYRLCMEDPNVTCPGGQGWLHVDMLYRKGWRSFKP